VNMGRDPALKAARSMWGRKGSIAVGGVVASLQPGNERRRWWPWGEIQR
jgi:hypothetical protein